MSFLFSRQPHLGIDLSDTDVRFVQLDAHKNIASSAVAALPSHAFDKEQILDASVIAQVIHTEVDAHNDWSKEVAFCIPDTQCFIHTITLPSGTTEDTVKAAVVAEAAKIIPVPQSDLVYDILKKDETHYLYVGALKTTIDTYQEVAKQAGLTLKVLDCDGLAFGRAFLKSLDDTSKHATLMVSIGDEVASITIFDASNQLLISSTVPYAAGRFAKSIVTSIRVVTTEKTGTLPTINLTPTSVPDDRQSETVLQMALKDVGKEVQAAFQHVTSLYQLSIEQVILAGELAIIPGIEEYFSHLLNLAVKVGNPLENMSTEKSQEHLVQGESPVLFAGAIGMGLWNEGINLMVAAPSSIFPFSKEAGSTTHSSESIKNEHAQLPHNDSLVKKVLGALFVLAALGGFGYVLYGYLIKPLIER